MTASTVIALLALLLSGASFYRTHLRRKADMIGWITDTLHEEDEDKPQVAWVRDYGVALSNSGTMDLLVREASVHLCRSSANLVPEVPVDELPAILKPGEVKLIRLQLPHRFVTEMEAERRAVISIEFQVFSARGRLYTPRKVVISGAERPGDLWASFRLGKVKG